MLDPGQTQRVTEAARLFLSVVRQTVPPAVHGAELEMFCASVAVQGATRAAMEFDGDNGEFVQRVLHHAGEGLGALIGLIPDREARAIVLQAVVASMAGGAAAQAQIHITEGTA